MDFLKGLVNAVFADSWARRLVVIGLVLAFLILIAGGVVIYGPDNTVLWIKDFLTGNL